MTKKLSQLILILIFILNIVLRIPSLFDPVYYGDECIYLTLGQAFNKGLVFYRDIHDNKPPLLYLMAAVAQGKLFWLRFITIIWNTFNIWLIYKLARSFFKKELPALISGFGFLALSLLPEGRIANGEIFMIMPFTLAVWLIWVKKSWFLAGLFACLGFLFKIPVAFDFVGIVLAFVIFKPNTFKEIINNFKKKDVYLLLIGFLAPIILSIIYYSLHQSFTPYVRSALMQNIGYLSSWSTDAQKPSFMVSNQGLLIRGCLLMIATFILFAIRKRLTFEFVLIALWFSYGLFGVLLSERPYPHYLIELAPSLSLMIVFLIFKFSWEKLLVSMLLISALIFSFIKIHFWWYPNIPYYKNFIAYAFGKISKNQYFQFFDSGLNDIYFLSRYIQLNTQDNDRIFVWGDVPCIYALSDRLPPGRYTANYHIFDFNGFEETALAINKTRPPFIVKFMADKRDFPQLNSILSNYYINTFNTENAQIYRRIKYAGN